LPEKARTSVARQSACSSLALALTSGPLTLSRSDAFIELPADPAKATLLCLSDGTSALLSEWKEMPTGAPVLNQLRYLAGRSYHFDDLVETGLMESDFGRMPVEDFSSGSFMLTVMRAPGTIGTERIFVGYISSDHQKEVQRFVRSRWPRITDKEAEVLAHLVDGRTIKEVASDLGKSITTTSIQARTALQKTGFGSSENLIAHIRRLI